MLPLLELCERRRQGRQQLLPETAGAPLAALRRRGVINHAPTVYDAMPDLPDNYEREQPLLRVSPVFPGP